MQFSTTSSSSARQPHRSLTTLAPLLRRSPWTKIVGLRNLIAHEYFRIDLDVIRAIVEEQLAHLDETAERLLEDNEAPST